MLDVGDKFHRLPDVVKVLLSVALLALYHAVSAAEIVAPRNDLTPPGPYLGCMDSQGRLNLDLNLKVSREDCFLPVYLKFCPSDNSTDSSLGGGWSMPIFDAKAFQTGERTFIFRHPNGSEIVFLRKGGTDELTGPSGWTAKLTSDDMLVSSDQGDTYLLKQGRIKEICIANGDRKFFIESRPSFGSVVKDKNGQTILSIEAIAGKDGFRRIVFGNGESYVDLEPGKRPLVQAIGGVNVVSGLVTSTASVFEPDGTVLAEVTYGVDDKLFPNIKIVRQKSPESFTFSWDPANFHVKSDGNYSYKCIVEGSATTFNKSKDGKTKYEILIDNAKRITRIADENGSIYESNSFASPKALLGRLRNTSFQDADGVKRITYKCQVDEKGRTIREFGFIDGKESETNYTYNDETGTAVVKCVSNGKEIWKKSYLNDSLQIFNIGETEINLVGSDVKIKGVK